MPITLEHLQSPTDEARALIAELDAELAGPYSAEQRHGLDISRIFRPAIHFFIARLDGDPVGCGGVAFEDGLAEVKRMYVRPRARGQGVAQALLARLESETRARDFDRLVLETGDAQKPAIRFYQRAGFTPCPAFGAYAKMRPSEIERSLFFEKRIW